VRVLWFLALAFAVVFDIAGTVFAVREVYRIEPPFNRLSLSSQTEVDASVTVSTIEGLTGVRPIRAACRAITAIDGKRVRARHAGVGRSPNGSRLTDGKSRRADRGRARRARGDAPDRGGRLPRAGSAIRADRARRGRWRSAGAGAADCVTLITCAVLLFLRRPRDPVALLFSFAFLAFRRDDRSRRCGCGRRSGSAICSTSTW
jgi:hypothetical protein